MSRIKVPMVAVITVVLLAAVAVSGCTSSSINVIPPAATAKPNAGEEATPVPSLTTTHVSSVTPEASSAPYGQSTPMPTATMAPSIYATPQASLSPTGTPTPVPTPTTVPDTTGVLTIDGHVKVPMDLTMYDLSQFPQISILDHTYGAHQQLFQMNASGPSLNDILNMAQPNSNALVATFYGTDGYDATMLLSQIRSDPDAIIATQWNTTDNSSAAGNGLRDVLPSQYYAEYWVYYLDKITIQ